MGDPGNAHGLPHCLLRGPSAGFSTSLSRYSGEQVLEKMHIGQGACGQCGEGVGRMLVSGMLVWGKEQKGCV